MDEDCWKDLLKKLTRVTKSEYESESIKVVTTSWIEYRAQELDVQSWANALENPEPPYHPNRTYYIDQRSIRTITNGHNDEIRTCFHEHFGGKHQFAAKSPGKTETMLRYINRLRNHQKSQQLRNLKIKKVASGLPELVRLAIEELRT
jgi:hypothetical protein